MSFKDIMKSFIMDNDYKHKIWYVHINIIWESIDYIFNSLIFRSRIVYIIPNLANAQTFMFHRLTDKAKQIFFPKQIFFHSKHSDSDAGGAGGARSRQLASPD